MVRRPLRHFSNEVEAIVQSVDALEIEAQAGWSRAPCLLVFGRQRMKRFLNVTAKPAQIAVDVGVVTDAGSWAASYWQGVHVGLLH